MDRFRLYFANQHLTDEDTMKPPVDNEGMSNIDATRVNNEVNDADGHDEESDRYNIVHADLEVAAGYLTSGSSFDLHKERLCNFLPL